MSKIPLKIFIFQTHFFKYRNFLWQEISKEFNQEVEKFSSFYLFRKRLREFNHKRKKIVIIINGSPRLFLIHFFLYFYPRIKVISLTQITKKNVFFKLFQYLYSYIIFSKTLFYYKSELNFKFSNLLKKKFDYFNNTTQNFSEKNIELIKEKISGPNKKEILVIGRDTNKSNYKLLFDALIYVKTKVKLNIVGIDKKKYSNEINKIKNNVSIEFFSQNFDHDFLKNLALKSDFALYPGDIGLSIVDYGKLGCIPVVHDNHKSHFPEYYNFKYIYNFPVVNFKNNGI